MRILSISPGYNSNVCVLNDKNVEMFLSESELTNIRNEDFPIKSLQIVYENYKDKKIDVVLCTDTSKDYDGHSFFKRYVEKLFSAKMESEIIVKGLVKHTSAAAASFYMSNFDDALVLVVDSNGSIICDEFDKEYQESETIFYASYPDVFSPVYRGLKTNADSMSHEFLNELRNRYRFSDLNFSKIGICDLYESANAFIGKGEYDGSYSTDVSLLSDKDIDFDVFTENNRVKYENFEKVEYDFFIGKNPYIYRKYVGKYESSISEENCTNPADYCNSLQVKTQNAIYSLLKKYIDMHEVKNVCITGRYATNHITNSFLLEKFPEINFYFDNNCDGSMLSVGLAMDYYRMISRDTEKVNTIVNYFDRNTDYNLSDKQTENIISISELSKVIQDKNIVAFVENNLEVGIKNLTSCCLLVNPIEKDFRKYLDGIKYRPWYKNYPIIILEEKFSEYFETYQRTKNENLMVSFRAKDIMIEKYPHILSKQNTCRVQTISKTSNHGKEMYELLSDFYDNTQCPFLVNTSFNVSGHCSPSNKEEYLILYSDVQENVVSKYGIPGMYFVDESKMITQKNEYTTDERIKKFFLNSEIKYVV